MEFMNDHGYKKTVATMEKETGLNYITQTPNENGLKVMLDFAERLLQGIY